MFFSGDESNPCGLYNWQHLLIVLICIALIISLIFITKKWSKEKIEKLLRILSIIIFSLEILKIIWNIKVGRANELDNVLPLYFCSLFIYALIAGSFFKGRIKLAGYTFLFYGGFVGGLAFLIYPSTSLLLFPAWHVLTIHSMIYHSLMIYVSIIIVIKKLFIPDKKYFLSYFLFTTIFCLIALLVNYIFPGNNLMFVKSGMKDTILEYVEEITGAFYPFVIIVFQNAGSFILSEGSYKLICKLKRS